MTTTTTRAERDYSDAQLRAAFGAFPTGVAAVAAMVGDTPVGFVVSSFSVGISISPAYAAFAVQKTSTTWPVLKQAPTLGISVLADHHGPACTSLAARDSTRRFAGVGHTVAESGAVLITDAVVWFECEIAHEFDAGDHSLLVMRIDAVAAAADAAPLVYHHSRFHRLTAQSA